MPTVLVTSIPTSPAKYCNFCLSPSLTNANCPGDIYSGNICPGNICPNQQYLSCYWPDFDQTFWTSILAISQLSFSIINKCQLSWWHLFRQHMSWQHLSKSAISQLLLTRVWPNFWDLIYFAVSIFVEHQFFTRLLLIQIFFWPHIFWLKISHVFLTKIFFW